MKSILDYGYVDFETKSEGYSEYHLKDGTIIRARAFLLKVTRDGSDFHINERKFAAAFSPSNLKGEANPAKVSPDDIAKSIKEHDIEILIQKEKWNEYELSTGDKLFSKVVLVSASLTDKFDEIGDPIYTVQLEVLHKARLKNDEITTTPSS